MKLPEGWVETTVGKVIVDLQPGFAQKPGENDEGMTPQVRTHNVSPEGKLTLEGIKHVSASADELEKYRLIKGDVIFNNTNSEEWVGKTAVFEEEGEYVFSNHMTRLRGDEALVVPEYLAGYLHLLWSVGFSKTRAKRWVSQAGIESGALAAFKLPLPTLPEQQRIVDVLRQAEEVRKLRSNFDDLLSRAKRQLFVEMIGDPVSNPHQLRKRPLGKLIKVKSGEFLPAKDMVEAGKYKVYGGNGINGVHDKYMFEERKVVIGRVGAYCGAVHYTEPQSWITDNALYVSEKLEYLNDIYLLTALEYANLNRYAGQAGQPLISAGRINKVEILVPDQEIQDNFAKTLLKLDEVNRLRDIADQRYVDVLATITQQALIGDLTETWRNQRHEEITAAAQTRDALLRERGAKLAARPPEPTLPSPREEAELSHRHWLLSELSDFQRAALAGFLAYDGHPLLTEVPDEFDRFRESDALSQHLAAFPPPSRDHLHRTLDQLAALGLIAKATLLRPIPDSREREYLTAFRPLRPDEHTQVVDLELLRRALRIAPSKFTHIFEVVLDYETSEHAGAGGMFQVASITDDKGKDRSGLVDQGKHYGSLDDLVVDIAHKLGVSTDQVDLVEV
jgi:type I restriction enzyme S subunit